MSFHFSLSPFLWRAYLHFTSYPSLDGFPIPSTAPSPKVQPSPLQRASWITTGIISRQTDGKRNGSCKSFGNSLNVRNRLLFWARTIFQCTRHELLLRCLLKGSLTVSKSKGVGSSLCPLRRNTLHRFQLPAEIQTKLVGRREKERRRFEVRVYFQTCKNNFCDRSVR